MASEIILNATKGVKAKKPFVVSMGGVAGSGGYYVPTGARHDLRRCRDDHRIDRRGGRKVCHGTKMHWPNKIGIDWDSSRRGANAALRLSSDHVFTDAERKKMQSWMNDIYGVFKGHGLPPAARSSKKPIDELAAGPRVHRSTGIGVGASSTRSAGWRTRFAT